MTSIASALTARAASASKFPGPDRTTVSGLASTTAGSLRATPIRTEPTSTARRTPALTEQARLCGSRGFCGDG